MGKKQRRLEYLQYFIIGSILLVSAGNNLGRFPEIGYFTLALGALVILHFVYELLRNGHNTSLQTVAHSVEAVALFMASYMSYKTGKTYLPFIFLLSSMGFVIAVVVRLLRKKHDASKISAEKH